MMRIVKPRLGDVDHRHRDAQARCRDRGSIGAMSGRPGSSSFCNSPLLSGSPISGNCVLISRPPRSNTRKISPGRHRLPGGQREELGYDPLGGHRRRGHDWIDDGRRLALVGGIGLAKQVTLVRQDAVVVRGAAPEHRGRGHQAARGRLDDRLVAGAAGLARDAIIARIDEAHEFGRFAIEQRVRPLRIGARWKIPFPGISRQDVRRVGRCTVRDVGGRRIVGFRDLGVAAVAIGAAEQHAGIDVHRRVIGGAVATCAAERFDAHILGRLSRRRGGGDRVLACHRRFALLRQHRRSAQQQQCQCRRQRQDPMEIARVHVNT